MEQSDVSLKAQVEKVISEEPTIDSSHIKVFAELGFINLNGEVSTLEQKTHAEQLVLQKTAAKGVFNYLVVRPVGLFGENH